MVNLGLLGSEAFRQEGGHEVAQVGRAVAANEVRSDELRNKNKKSLRILGFLTCGS